MLSQMKQNGKEALLNAGVDPKTWKMVFEFMLI